MKDLLLFVSAILIYFSLSYGLYRIYKLNFCSDTQDESSRRSSARVVSGLMTACSLAAAVVFQKPLLAMPGVYVGLVLSMLLGGERHGPGDPYSWMLFAAPTNFVLYYWVVRLVAKRFPSLFC
jgi:ABC-type tungstate transport system substrate-binding protein